MKAGAPSSVFRKRLVNILIVVMLALGFLSFIIPEAVHATGPAQVNQCSSNTASGTVLNCNIGTSGSSDFIVLGLSAGAATVFATPTDTLGTVYTTKCFISGAAVCIAYGRTTSTGVNTPNWGWTTTSSGAFAAVEFSAASTSGVGICTATGSGSGVSFSTSGTCPGGSTDFAMEVGAVKAVNTAVTQGTGFTSANSVSAATASGRVAACGGGSTYATCGSIATPTSFPLTSGSTGSWADVGIEVGALNSNNNGYCFNGQATCYEDASTLSATSGTSMNPTVASSSMPSLALTNPFTEVVTVMCAGSQFYPTSVSSANFGAMSNQGTLKGSAVLKSYLPNAGSISSITSESLSWWFVTSAGTTTVTSDSVTVTFGADISTTESSKGCMVIVGFVLSTTGQNWVPFVFGGGSGTAINNGGTTSAFNGFQANSGLATLAVSDIGISMNTQVPVTKFYAGSSALSSAWTPSGQCSTIGSCSTFDGSFDTGTLFSQGNNNYLAEESGYFSAGITSGDGGISIYPTSNTATNWLYVGDVIYFLGSQTTTVTNNQQGIGATPGTTGACAAAKNGFKLVNSTMYMYEGNALGQEVVNTVSVTVRDVNGSLTRKLQLVVYISGAQSVSGINPLVRSWNKTFTLSPTASPQQLTVNVNIPLNSIVVSPLPVMPANTWAVGVVGDSHISINQSAVSGLFTQSANPSGGNQPASFSTVGTPVATKLSLCAVGQYQSIVAFVQTVVSQMTVTAGTTSTVLTTQQINQANPTSLSFWAVPVFFLSFFPLLFLTLSRVARGR